MAIAQTYIVQHTKFGVFMNVLYANDENKFITDRSSPVNALVHLELCNDVFKIHILYYSTLFIKIE